MRLRGISEPHKRSSHLLRSSILFRRSSVEQIGPTKKSVYTRQHVWKIGQSKMPVHWKNNGFITTWSSSGNFTYLCLGAISSDDDAYEISWIFSHHILGAVGEQWCTPLSPVRPLNSISCPLGVATHLYPPIAYRQTKHDQNTYTQVKIETRSGRAQNHMWNKNSTYFACRKYLFLTYPTHQNGPSQNFPTNTKSCAVQELYAFKTSSSNLSTICCLFWNIYA